MRCECHDNMAYIPPHLRKKSVSHIEPELPPSPAGKGSLTLLEIDNHFWPANENEIENGHHPATDGAKRHTLHNSAANPDGLAYVILFNDANPRWNSDNIIFTKSSLELLPQEPTEHDEATPGSDSEQAIISSPSDTTNDAAYEAQTNVDSSCNQPSYITAKPLNPIAVFKQVAGRNHTRGFKFDGWYNVDRVEFQKLNSPELVRMLEQKWARKDRNGKTYIPARKGAEWE